MRLSYFRIYLLALAICAVSLATNAPTAHAQSPSAFEENTQRAARVRLNIPARPEPGNLPVTYLELPPAPTIQERIDRLVFGITADIPPQYDHYGYEIRRYMAQIFNPAIFEDYKRLEEERENIRKAGIVLDYWRKDLRARMKGIEEEIEVGKLGTRVRGAFDYNRDQASTFLALADAWIRYNKQVLDFMHENHGRYTLREKNIMVFMSDKERDVFAELYKVKEETRAALNAYIPFAGMVY